MKVGDCELKKGLVALIFAFVSLAGGFADDFSLSIEPVFGIRSGQLDEYVFVNECAYDDDKLSELNWHFDREFYIGAKVEGAWKFIFASTELNFAIPMRTGLMMDSDWLNVQSKNAEDYQYKTNYSISDNYLDSDFNFSIKTGFNFPLLDFPILSLSLKPFVGFDYNSIKFNAKYGNAWYGKSNSKGFSSPYDDEENQIVYTFDDKVISYERQTYIFWLGFDGEVDFSKAFSISTGFQFSPYIYAESIDTHWLTKYMFGDKTPGFFSAFRWRVSGTTRLTSRLSAVVNASWLYVRVLRGDDYCKRLSDASYTKATDADGGAGEHYFDLSIGLKVRIF